MNTGRKSGFTLLELLTVVVIIGLLVGMTASASVMLRKKANVKKRNVQKQALASAARSYRHEYNRWPCVHSGVLTSNNKSVDHGDFLDHLVSSMDPRSGGSKNEVHNPKNIHFMRSTDFEINSSDEIIDPVSKRPFELLVNFASDKFWVNNG